MDSVEEKKKRSSSSKLREFRVFSRAWIFVLPLESLNPDPKFSNFTIPCEARSRLVKYIPFCSSTLLSLTRTGKNVSNPGRVIFQSALHAVCVFFPTSSCEVIDQPRSFRIFFVTSFSPFSINNSISLYTAVSKRFSKPCCWKIIQIYRPTMFIW